MQKKESNKQSRLNKNNQGLTSGAPTANVSKNIFGAGSIIQEVRNRLVKLSNNASNDKSTFGLENIDYVRPLHRSEQTLIAPVLPILFGNSSVHWYTALYFYFIVAAIALL
ncbi:MAG: hypothetical protein RMX96_34700 [Nostoc sp. ChiSLP02]|nr:hypothetical protein [Nostoc sp. ChiSLP02]